MADSKHHDESEKSEVPTPSLPATTEQERELAQRATSEFERGDYERCLVTISRLAETRGHDLKVIHNQAVASYYLHSLTKTDEFKRALNDLHSKVSLDEIAALDDVDQCIIYYNHAVVLYYTKQYKAAFALLDKVMQFIEPMDENIARRVAFLMVELYLASHQPYKALQIVTFIEKNQIGTSKSSSPDKDKDRDDEQHSEMWKAAISQYKVRCCLMMKSVKLCKREMKALIGSAGSAVPTTFHKSQLEYLRGNYQKSIRMLSSIAGQVLNGAPSHNLAAMYYNNLGILHFNMRKHHLGMFYMRRAVEENNNAMRQDLSSSSHTLYQLGMSRHYELIYNLGVQLLHCGQPQAAFDCLLETVQQFQVNPYLWLRLAECCIMVQRPNNDVDRNHSKKMEVVSSSVGSGLHRKLILGSGVRVEKLSAVLESMAIPTASMEFAALCLDNALLLLPETTASTQLTTSDGQSEQRQTADTILVPAPPGNPLRSDDVASLRCSVLASRAYVALYHNDYLVALHHAQKLLRQPRLSGSHKYLGHMYMAESLVALDRIADGIDHLNADLITDISTVFPIDQKQDQDKLDKNGDGGDLSDQSEFKGARYPWSPSNVTQAKAIMTYNLAVTHTIRGEHDKGLQNLAKIAQPIGHPLPVQMYYLRIYLELLEGRRKVLQNVFRDHFGHVSANR